MRNDLFRYITGKRPVIIVEGDTDLIFLEGLRNSIPECSEPDYLLLGGVTNISSMFALLVKSQLFNSIPSVKVIVDCDGNVGRLNSLKAILFDEGLQEGGLNTVQRSLFKSSLDDTIKVGAFLLRGENPDSPDLEGLISDSHNELSNHCREFLGDTFFNSRGFSKRLRFAERACNSDDLRDVSYHSLYGQMAGIDFDSPSFQALRDFMMRE